MAKKKIGGNQPAEKKVVKRKVRKEKKPTDKLADRTALTKFLQGVFGDAQKKILKKLWKRAQKINKLEPKYEKMSDKELKAQSEKFREKIRKALKEEANTSASEITAKQGKKRKKPLDDTKILNEILPEAFAVAREAS